MKIQMLESISGPTGSYRAGDIWDNPDAEDAKRIVAAGLAIRVDDVEDAPASKIETPEAKQAAKRSKR